MFIVNLGGEGEVANALIQQPPFALAPGWRSLGNKTIAELADEGHKFLICPNDDIALPPGSVDFVITSNVPINRETWLGLGVQTSQIDVVLKQGGRWNHDNLPVYTKP